MRGTRVRILLGIVGQNGYVALLVRRSALLIYRLSLFASAATETRCTAFGVSGRWGYTADEEPLSSSPQQMPCALQ